MQDLSLQNKSTTIYESLKNPSTDVIQNGVSALDLIPSQPLSNETFIKGSAILQASYGVEYSKEKFAVLFDFFKEDKWSEERFMRTLKYVLRHNVYPNWNIATWYAFNPKVYPAVGCPVPDGAEYYIVNGEFNDNYENDNIITKDGILVWKLADGQELPFVKLKKINGKFNRKGI